MQDWNWRIKALWQLFGPVTKCDFDLLWIKALSETFFALALTLTYPNALL